ncbi:MAG: metal-dependent hydrolase [Halorhabdus sp.]
MILGGLGGLIGLNQGMVGTVGPGAVGAVVGIVTIGSHVLADALTPMGVRPFVPESDRESALGLTTVATPLANGALFVLGIVATGLAVVGTNALADLLG